MLFELEIRRMRWKHYMQMNDTVQIDLFLHHTSTAEQLKQKEKENQN